MRTVVALLLTLTAVCALNSAGAAGVIALWNFNDQNLVVDEGAGTLTSVNTVWNFEDDPTKVSPNDPGGLALEIYGWPVQAAARKTHGIRFDVPTTGRSSIKVRLDMRHNIKNYESGPNTSTFQYSVDGGSTWIDGPTWTASGDQWYLNREIDLSSDPLVDNNPSFAFRFVADWQPGYGRYMPCVGAAYATNRKWRLDLVTVHDDPPPAMPNTIALWDFNDQRDLVADYGDATSAAELIGGVALDGDGYSDDFPHGEEPWDSSGSSDPSLKGKAFDTVNYPAQGAGNRAAGVQFNVSTAGHSGIRIYFDVKHKFASSRFVRVQYTTNRNAGSVVWVNALPLFDHQITDTTQDAWWFNGNAVDLTDVPGVNDNPNFAFRIVTEFSPDLQGQYEASRAGAVYGGPNNKHRFDMVRVTADSPASDFVDATIPEAKQAPERERVSLTDAIVTAVHPDYFWVGTNDRASGLKIYRPQHNLSFGWAANVSGVTRVGRDTEKYIYARSVNRSGSEVSTPIPFHIPGRYLGGGSWFHDQMSGAGQVGVPGGIGLNNVGLLVKVCGRVTAFVEEHDDPGYYEFMYVDDGSGLYDGNLLGPGGTPAPGTRVVLPKNFSGEYLGKFVEVTGISSIDRLGSITDEVVRCIRRPIVSEVSP